MGKSQRRKAIVCSIPFLGGDKMKDTEFRIFGKEISRDSDYIWLKTKSGVIFCVPASDVTEVDEKKLVVGDKVRLKDPTHREQFLQEGKSIALEGEVVALDNNSAWVRFSRSGFRIHFTYGTFELERVP